MSISKEQLVDVCLLAGFGISFVPDGISTIIRIEDELRSTVLERKLITDVDGAFSGLGNELARHLTLTVRPLTAALSLLREAQQSSDEAPEEIR